MVGKMLRHAGWILPSAVLTVLAFSGGWLPSHWTFAWRVAVHVGLLLILAAIVCGYLWFLGRRRGSIRHPEVDAELAPGLLSLLGGDAVLSLDGDTAFELIELLQDRRSSRTRIIDHVGIEDGHRTHRVSVEVAVQHRARENLLLPLLSTKKGRLRDNFSVHGADDTAYLALPYRYTVGLLWQLVEVLVAQSNVARGQRARLTQLVLACIVSDPKTAGEYLKAATFMLEQHPPGTPEGVAAHSALENLMDELRDRHILIIPVPQHDVARVGDEDHFLVKYHYTEPTVLRVLPSHSDTPRAAAWKATLRTTLLGASDIVRVPAHRGLTCDSYHLRVTVPDGLVIAHQELFDERLGQRVPIPLTRSANLQSTFVTWTPARHQRFAHMYARNLREARAVDDATVVKPALELRIAERLPGTLGAAAATGLATLFAIWIAAALYPTGVSISGSDGFGPPADLVAFMLALPTIPAAYLGLSVAGRRAYSSLSAHVSTLASLVLSIVATALFLGKASGRLPAYYLSDYTDTVPWSWLPGQFNLLFARHIDWIVMLLFAMFNAAWMTILLVHRSVHMLQRDRED